MDEVPAKPVELKTLEKTTVVWHKNYVIERESHIVPPTPTPDTEVLVVPQDELQQTGEHTSNAGVLGFISMIFSAFVGFFKCRKEE